jgi:hypothetical protein
MGFFDDFADSVLGTSSSTTVTFTDEQVSAGRAPAPGRYTSAGDDNTGFGNALGSALTRVGDSGLNVGNKGLGIVDKATDTAAKLGDGLLNIAGDFGDLLKNPWVLVAVGVVVIVIIKKI